MLRLSLDGFVLNALVNELNREFSGARIEKIHQPHPHTLTILLGGKGKKQRLISSVDPQLPKFLVSTEQHENPLTPPFFCLLLRKFIEGARLETLAMDGFERVITANIAGRDELGNPALYRLMVELTGRHSNIVLVSPDGVIIDAIKRVSLSLSALRPLLPGLRYELPPAQERISPLTITGEEIFLATQGSGRAIHHVLSELTQGLSQLLAREIAYRLSLQNVRAEEVSLKQCRELAAIINRLAASARGGDIAYGHLYRGEKTLFHVFPLSHLGRQGEIVQGVNNLVATALAVSNRNQQEELLRQRLRKAVHTLLEKIQRKILALEEDIRSSQERDIYKRFGDLLYANMGTHRIDSGDAVVTDFYHEELPEVRIPLDPKLSFADNAKAYFKKYTRALSAEKHAIGRIQESREQADYLERLASTIELADDVATLREIEVEMQEMGLTPKATQIKKAQPVQAGPLQFTSPDGLSVLVGRNNLQNDRLVRLAQPDNLWFHVQKAPGSHVLVQATTLVPESTILFAANLAAYYSSQRESANVPVDYTERRNLRRPAGAKPGYVIYENQKTIYIRRPEKP